LTEVLALSISGLAIFSTAYLEIDRRRRESQRGRLQDRRITYASFMAHIVRWQHAIVAEYEERRHATANSTNDHQTAKVNLRMARQEAMAPLFELRMIGNTDVVALGEEVATFNYAYEKMHQVIPATVPVDGPHPEWVDVRDRFIKAVRNELKANEKNSKY